MSRLAHADMTIERAKLAIPGEKAKIRVMLYRALMKLGQVESVERYVLDPPDGPMRDPEIDLDTDAYAVVRIVGRVVPLS